MDKTILALTFISVVNFGCSKSNDSVPQASQATGDNPVVGLWLIEHEIDEDLDVDENDPVDIYAKYFEITDDSYIFYLTDGVSNCYEADILPLEYIAGNTYQIDLADIGIFSIDLEATESTLTSSNFANTVDDDSSEVESGIETFSRVNNIMSQDFNLCAFD